MKIEELIQISKNTTFNNYFCLLICSNEACYQFPNIDFTPLKLEGLIDFECKLTKKGEELLSKCGKPIKSSVNFLELHKKLCEELKTLTGKKQKLLQGKYGFIPNARDLETKLLKVSKKYKLSDWVKIEKLLLQYIYNSYKANFEYVQTIEYYIEKNNSSRLATDYENFLEKQEIEYKKVDTFNI